MDKEVLNQDVNPTLGIQNIPEPPAITPVPSKFDRKIESSIKLLNLSGDEVMVTNEIPGVFIQGVQYYDLKNIGSINYTGMANLIDFLKSLLEQDIEVKFVNVNDKIKSKIKSIGLEHILHCV